MKKVISLMLILLLLLGAFNADIIVTAADIQAPEGGSSTALKVKFDKIQGLYGYVNSSGSWAIEPRFENAQEFSEGAAAVNTMESGWKWGYIRPDGTFLIEPEFEGANAFIDGFAVVSKAGLAATIDKSGNYIMSPKFYLQGAVTNDKKIRAIITDKNPSTGTEILKYGAITAEGKLIEPKYDGQPSAEGEVISVFIEDASKNIDKRRNFLIFPNGKEVEYKGYIMEVSDGVRRLNYGQVDGRNRYGFILEDGTIIEEYISSTGKKLPFIQANSFSEGLASVAVNSIPLAPPIEDKWGFMKKDGTWLTDLEYERAGSFKEGTAPVKNFLGWGYINKDLSWSIPIPELVRASRTDEELNKAMAEDFYTQEEYDFSVNTAKEICGRLIKPSMSDYEKLVKLNDYITDRVEYDGNYYRNNIPRVSYTAYGALKYGKAVCEGYAETLGLMLTIAGVENERIAGTITSSGVGHAWNLVKIGGEYYHVDATWNDTSNNMFLLVSDEFMSTSRIWNTGSYPAAPKSYPKR